MKKLGEKGLKKFERAMKKYAREEGGSGIKLLKKGGISGYPYEVKIKGGGGAYRLLGRPTGTDSFIWEVFERTH